MINRDELDRLIALIVDGAQRGDENAVKWATDKIAEHCVPRPPTPRRSSQQGVDPYEEYDPNDPRNW